MKLDAQTLYVVLISAYFLLGFTMLYTFRRPLDDGEDIWTVSLFVGAGALVLLVTRHTLPDLFSLVLANVLISVQYSLQYLALCRVFKYRPSKLMLYAPSLIAALAFSMQLPTQEAGHIQASGLIVGIQHIPMFLLVWGERAASGRATRHLLLLAIALNGGRFLFRALAASVSPESTPSIFGPIHAATLLLAPIYIILATFAMAILYRDRAEGRVRASRNLFKSIIEGTSDSIFTKDRDGRYQLVNQAGSRFMGRPLEQIVGRDDASLFTAAAADRVMASDRAILESGAVATAEEVIEPVYGEKRIVQVVKGPIFDENGEVGGVFGIARDVSESKRIEAALRESEDRYRRLFLLLPEALFVHRNDVIIYANDKAAELFRAGSVHDLVGVDWHRLIAPEHWPSVELRRTWLLSGEVAQLPMTELKYMALDGLSIQAESSGACVVLDGSQVIVTVVRDISAHKQTEAALLAAKHAAENANLTKTRFLAAVSHDLRQPIQAIGLFLNVLERTDLNDAQRNVSRHVSESVKSLDDLLNELLDISKLDSGAVKPQFATVTTDDLLTWIESEFAIVAQEKDLRFKLFGPRQNLLLFTDPRLLMSLLRNLIGNAIKYTQHCGLLVGIRPRPGHVLIQVWDTGVGIAPEHMESIFEEYFQVGNQERDRSKGLGLGLSIVKRLGRLLGTQVVCHSRPGRGTVFEFSLPRAAKAPAERSQSGQPAVLDSAGVSAFGGRRIVVVEDDEMVGRAIELSLESLGMSVSLFGNAEAALAHHGIWVADYYISDFRLPGMNGQQLLDAIQQGSGDPIKAVLLTGDATPGAIATDRSFHWTVLRKPVDLPTLLATLESQSTDACLGADCRLR